MPISAGKFSIFHQFTTSSIDAMSMRERITLLREATTRDEFGEATPAAPVTLGQQWACVAPNTGKKIFEAEHLAGEMEWYVVVRCNALSKALTPDNWLDWTPRQDTATFLTPKRLYIYAVMPNQARSYILLVCYEKQR